MVKTKENSMLFPHVFISAEGFTMFISILVHLKPVHHLSHLSHVYLIELGFVSCHKIVYT